ncbi:MAG: MEDS domain-containing protein [Candidatus Bathyarchaeota archaeon]|nr:MEDS domain-containing protein [Candidatus Bathyarchaeum sp.]
MFTKKALLGDHNVCFYDSLEEKQRVLFSNLKAGLDKGCAAVYVATEENVKQLKSEMKKFGLKLEDPKKLRITSSQQMYIPDGEFHVDRVVDNFMSVLDESLDNGFDGMFVSSDVSKVFDYMTRKGKVEEWLKCERELGRTVQFPAEGICAYTKKQVISANQVFLKLIQAHKNTVNAKKLEFVDNEKICIQVVMEKLDGILGKESSELIFRFLEKRFSIPRIKILPQIVEFSQCLELLFGDGAITIEKHILKELHNKTGIEYAGSKCLKKRSKS